MKLSSLFFLFSFQVLDLMKEVTEDKGSVEEEDGGNGSDISGYHSDSESAVMTSGNSPFISKEARYSFLSRSGEWNLKLVYFCVYIFIGGRNTFRSIEITVDRLKLWKMNSSTLLEITRYQFHAVI